MIFNFFPWKLLNLMSKLFIQYLSAILFPHNPKYDFKYLEFNRLLFDRKITGPYLETLTVCYCLLGAFSYWLKKLMTSKFSCRCHFSMLVYSPSVHRTFSDQCQFHLRFISTWTGAEFSDGIVSENQLILLTIPSENSAPEHEEFQI